MPAFRKKPSITWAPQSCQVEWALLLNMQQRALQLGSWAQHLPYDVFLICFLQRDGK